MCLILLAYQVHPRYSLILAANRDEFYERPTESAGFWHDFPDLLAGKDLKGGGTWLGMTRQGRFGALTNYRDPNGTDPAAPTRGRIVIDYLTGKCAANTYLTQLSESDLQYNKFSVILGSVDDLYYFSNSTKKLEKIEKGVHGLCNHLLDTPWPKVVRGSSRLEKLVTSGKSVKVDDLLTLLTDKQLSEEDVLPDTGVEQEFEKVLSPIFIRSPHYGTRCSTILMIDNNGHVTFIEKTYPLPGTKETLKKFNFSIRVTK